MGSPHIRSFLSNRTPVGKTSLRGREKTSIAERNKKKQKKKTKKKKKTKDLTFNELGVKVLVSKSKTDQLREGNLVFISKTGTKYCPVNWLQTYLKMTKLINNPDAFLLRRLFKTKAGHNEHGLKPISYSTALTTFKVHVSAVSTNHKFSPHSLRSGGGFRSSRQRRI